MTPTDQALAALSRWPPGEPLGSHHGASATRHRGGNIEIRATLRYDPDGKWRSHLTSGGATLGSGVATTPEAALEQATTAARDRLKVLASLLA